MKKFIKRIINVIITTAAFASCTAPRQVAVQPGTITISQGKLHFTPTGPKKPVADTVINNAFLIKKM